MTSPVFVHALSSDRELVDRQLDTLFSSASATGDSKVHEAMRYAVLGPGQRLRPILALRVARALDTAERAVLPAAAAVELLHCASLVVDDLPCMDDEPSRRNRPTVHVAFGESTAVLSAFALVALSARVVVERDAPASLLLQQLDFQDRLLGMLDCSALIAGQALDLRLTAEASAAKRSYVNQLKTVPLFQLAVRAGLIGSDPRSTEAKSLLEFGGELGAAYQAADDIIDGEATGGDQLEQYLTAGRRCLRAIDRDTRDLEGLLDYIHAKAWQKDRCHR